MLRRDVDLNSQVHRDRQGAHMGKGDQRSRRGKIWRGTNGKSRPQNGKKRDHEAEAKSTA